MWLIPSSVIARIVAISILFAHQSTVVATIPGALDSYLAAHPILTQTTVLSNPSNKTLSPSVVNSVISQCPASCDDSGLNPSNWTAYHDLTHLSLCNQTMLLDFALYNPIDDPLTHLTLRSCAANFASSGGNVSNGTNNGLCPSKGNLTQVQEPLQMAFNESDSSGSIDDFMAASQQMAGFLAQQEPTCNDTIAFSYNGSVAVGLFGGSGIQSQDIPTSVLQQFIAQVEGIGISESVLVQLCAANNRSSRYSLGIIANANADIGFVQNAVSTWASGGCITTYDNAEVWQNITLLLPSLLSQTNSTSSNSTYSRRSLNRRDSCTTIQVASGDTCKYL
jgi:chitinase